MTELDASFETWLTRATDKLVPDAVERIRTEIGDHYRHTVASGAAPEQALAALGDPKQANRDYRRVFLTVQEALFAPGFTTQPRRGWRIHLFALSPLAWLALSLWMNSHCPTCEHPPGISFWASQAFGWVLLPLRMYYPPDTQERARRYILLDVVLLTALGLLFSREIWWLGPLMAPFAIPFIYLDYKLWNIHRKLAGNSAPSFFLPGEPRLTRIQASYLFGVRNQKDSTCLFCQLTVLAVLSGLTFWQPLLVGPITVVTAAVVLLPRVVDLYTPTRGRWFRRGKWILLALAAVLPYVLGARGLWAYSFVGGFVGAGIAFVAYEILRAHMRRDLPVEDWPKDLYL